MFQTSFTYGEYGYGTTIALLLTMLCLLVTLFIFRSSRRDLDRRTDRDDRTVPRCPPRASQMPSAAPQRPRTSPRKFLSAHRSGS